MANAATRPEVVIVDAARSAVGRKNGGLSTVHPTDILGQVFTKLLERNQLEIGRCRSDHRRLHQ